MEGCREIELFIGPLEEWRGNVGTGAIGLICNGNNTTMRIDVNISKTIVSVSNNAEISIYNLSTDTRHMLRAGLRVRLYAGYEGEAKEMIFSGGIMAVETERQGTDIITKMTCLSGSGPLVRSTTSKTYSHGVKVADAVREIASTIPGIVVDPTNIKVSGSIGYAGWSVVGSTKDALDRLANQYGFSWSIDNEKFVAVQDGRAVGGRVLLDSSNGLRKVSPRLTGPLFYQEGVDIQATYCPGVYPGTSVTVHSELQNIRKTYAVHSASYSLAPKTGAWDMRLTSFFTFGNWQ